MPRTSAKLSFQRAGERQRRVRFTARDDYHLAGRNRHGLVCAILIGRRPFLHLLQRIPARLREPVDRRVRLVDERVLAVERTAFVVDCERQRVAGEEVLIRRDDEGSKRLLVEILADLLKGRNGPRDAVSALDFEILIPDNG